MAFGKLFRSVKKIILFPIQLFSVFINKVISHILANENLKSKIKIVLYRNPTIKKISYFILQKAIYLQAETISHTKVQQKTSKNDTELSHTAQVIYDKLTR